MRARIAASARAGRLVRVALVTAGVLLQSTPPAAHGQSSAVVPLPLPFAIGERLVYRVRMSGVGSVGTGSMWIEGPVDVRGTPTLLFRSSFEAHKGPIHATARSDSWFDAVGGVTLRYEKHETRPFSDQHERVEMFPAEQRWANASGTEGTSLTALPLDELSFIYYVRTLDLCADTSYSSNRHYDVAKNPVVIRVLRREIITTGAGTFPTVVVEMRVTDAKRFRNGGVVTLFLSDDARRLPVRIDAPAPMFGTATFTLESYSK